jgi:hypothetical protein
MRQVVVEATILPVLVVDHIHRAVGHILQVVDRTGLAVPGKQLELELGDCIRIHWKAEPCILYPLLHQYCRLLGNMPVHSSKLLSMIDEYGNSHSPSFSLSRYNQVFVDRILIQFESP